MEISELEEKLLYKFKNKFFLDEACRHSSYVNEQIATDLRDNERLEFLGDAVLSLVVGHLLMQNYPDLPEGDLSRMRASLVNEYQLAKIAKMIDLGSYVKLGKGEIQTDGRKKKSILADTFEAVIAAVYLDGGFDAAFKFIKNHFSTLLPSIGTSASNYDYKSQLQEIVQVSQRVTPFYKVIQESGPDHDKTFIVQINVGEFSIKGVGKSKKMAEQDAARRAIETLELE
ncbi:ribonuclease III [Desulfonema magnum]|uniref:Ribonuclease 3 n=1 Tax=Desulfonema magnum TaxID=45655 RepID=A0A975BIK3_9BACT|nr:ribonuclease III [Desulfonema magnum]QTA85750.1 Ribonuclease III [Desulfonema magnum]